MEEGVLTIIQGTITELTTDATPVIAGAIGLGAMFFGAKYLWTKFKSMAR